MRLRGVLGKVDDDEELVATVLGVVQLLEDYEYGWYRGSVQCIFSESGQPLAGFYSVRFKMDETNNIVPRRYNAHDKKKKDSKMAYVKIPLSLETRGDTWCLLKTKKRTY